MKNLRVAICLIVVVLAMTARQGFGIIYFNDGGVHNINTMLWEQVWVDWQQPDMHTTVNLLEGGRLLHGYPLYAFNNSKINISGGRLDDYLYALDSSQIIITSVYMGSGFFEAHDSSKVTISGGMVYELRAYDNSFATMSGGTIGRYYILENQSILTLDGSNFAVDGIPIVSGEIKSLLGGDWGNEPFRTLTGTLANGDIIDNQFCIGHDAKIVLVPEPASALLLAIGAVLIRLQNKRH